MTSHIDSEATETAQIRKLKVELAELEHIVWSCKDFEEPVPRKVRQRIAEVKRELVSSGASS
ncbi:MAG: hypothetical protein V3W41_22295 [Planctomycetota bacterium]